MRTNAALPKSELLEIQVPEGTQPCNTFGVHHKLEALQKAYTKGDAAFFANIGAMVEPVNKTEYQKKLKRLPPSLFAHNVMQRSMVNMPVLLKFNEPAYYKYNNSFPHMYTAQRACPKYVRTR